MARFGFFDPDLKGKSWFNYQLYPEGWFDEDLITLEPETAVVKRLPATGSGGGDVRFINARPIRRGYPIIRPPEKKKELDLLVLALALAEEDELL